MSPLTSLPKWSSERKQPCKISWDRHDCLLDRFAQKGLSIALDLLQQEAR